MIIQREKSIAFSFLFVWICKCKHVKKRQEQVKRNGCNSRIEQIMQKNVSYNSPPNQQLILRSIRPLFGTQNTFFIKVNRQKPNKHTHYFLRSYSFVFTRKKKRKIIQ
uniref:(northern house mosquito) hypothetical protein n=1 Tax=Culex pipiens TaxID=7175 RepID=A0A8D8C442_CULPI